MTMEGVHRYGIRLLITRLTRSRPASYFVSINQTIWPRQGDEKAELIVIDPSRHNYFNAELWRSLSRVKQLLDERRVIMQHTIG